MAHIHIQRKRRPLWPWVLGLVAGALLVWLLMRALGKEADPGNLEPIPDRTEQNISGKAAPGAQRPENATPHEQ